MHIRRSGRAAALFVALSTVALLWPAFLNHYPLIFGDTGAYLSDGLHLHISWPRPFFYGVAIVPLHLKLSVWPIVVAQAALTAALLRLTLVTFLPDTGERFRYAVVAVLAAATALPWFAAQIMPDLFGALAVLALASVALRPERFGTVAQLVWVLLAAGMTTFHQSFVPLMTAVCLALLLLRRQLQGRIGARDVARLAAPVILPVALIVAANAVFQGSASFSPYGRIFLLARAVIEGPARRTLERECPKPGWTLCDQLGALPATVEAFQFGADGTVSRAGGHVAVAAQAGPILAETLRAEPGAMIGNAARRAAAQFVTLTTGDWLLQPKPDMAADWRGAFPPGEVARFEAARQQRNLPLVPIGLQMLHQAAALVSIGVLALAAAVEWRRRSALGALLIVILVALVANAVISGALSGVYGRYQSRVVWLAVLGSLMWLQRPRLDPPPA